MEKEKIYLISVIILFALVIGLTCYIIYDKSLNNDGNNNAQNYNDLANNNENNNSELITDNLSNSNDFKKETGTGKVEVLGYVTLEKRNEITCDLEECKKYDYVLFNILKAENKDFLEYVESNIGNMFFGTNSIGLGCVENTKLMYTTISEEFHIRHIELYEYESSKILNSTLENPIKLELEFLTQSGRSAIDTCSSFVSYLRTID